MNAVRRRISTLGPPILAGLIVLLLWEFSVRNIDRAPQAIQDLSILLPKPSDIFDSLVENWSAIWEAARNTGFVIVTGLIMGVLAGAVIALTVTRFRTANETLTPLAIALNAIPIIALAPIFNAWFGTLSPRSNQAVVIIIVFFPVFVNTARGLTEVDSSQLELMRSYAASDWKVTREVRIPNAMPYFFTALRIVASLSVIAAIVAEYFGGRQDALGQLIVQEAGQARYADAWAGVSVAAAIGILLYLIAVTVERIAMPWNNATEQDAA
jgi:NitT/TauT family transport system permease protein